MPRQPEALSHARVSRLFPGSRLVFADLHNHSLLSDGEGHPAEAFWSMRDAGLDVAALTDHTTGKKLPELGVDLDCGAPRGIDERAWQVTRHYADAAEQEGSFVALRGFEWTRNVPPTGHVNVWFSRTWTDPVATAHTWQLEAPTVAGRHGGCQDPALPGLYDWLVADSGRRGVGGGADGLAGFNHPGREAGRFAGFAYHPRVRDRMVSLEVFNRYDDYLFEGTDAGRPSPVAECLDAGWRPGLAGVTDEHGAEWGVPEGKGRTGMWVDRLTRDGVKAAMVARRFYATTLRDFRLDVAARPRGHDDDAAVGMGGVLPHRRGPVTFAIDVARGADWAGTPLSLQVLRPGRPLPQVLDAVDLQVPAPGAASPCLTVHLDADDGPWVVLRLTDPYAPADPRADGLYTGFGAAVAYASPFHLDPP